jgi:hypothetical protein
MPPKQQAQPESRFDPWEVVDLLGGFAVVALPLFLLAVPSVVLLGYLLVPLAVLGLVAAILVAPPLLALRAIRSRRRRSRSRPASMSRSGDVPRRTAISTMTERPA